MEITIKKIGTRRGTVGWLAAGLADGTLTLEEGTMKATGNHGLWLKGGNGLSQFLAGYNQYNLSMAESSRANRYELEEYDVMACTEACWLTLRAIARQWCDECNAAIAAEEPLDIRIIRAEEEKNEQV